MKAIAKHRRVRREKKIPNIRFGSFEEDWAEKNYGDVFEFKNTNSFSRDALNYENGIVKNIHYGDIHTKFQTNFDIVCEDVPYINQAIDISKIKDENYCKEGDLVIADASEDYTDVGKTIELRKLDDQKVVAGLHTYIARPKNGVFALGFPGYLLQAWTIRLQIMMLAQGTKVHGISSRHLVEVLFKFPSLPEQQKIASFLTAVDKKIQQLTRKKELLEQYKKGVMQKLFSQQIRFRDEDGNDYPEWEEKKLGEISKFLDGRRKPIKSGDRSKMQGEFPYYGASGIIDYVNSYIFDEDLILLGEDGENIISRNLPLAFRVSGKCWVNNHAHVMVPLSNYDIDFLTYSLERINYLQYNTGTAQPKLNQEVCKKIKLQMPTLSEQQKIANYLSNIDNKIKSVNNQITQTQTFKKGLLQQMFV